MIAGIYPAGEESAHLHVCNAVRGHRFVHGLISSSAQASKLCSLGANSAVPITLDIQLPVFIGEIVCGGSL